MGNCKSAPENDASLIVEDSGAFHQDKDSLIIAPEGLASPAKACVVVHGCCCEMNLCGVIPDWEYPLPLARQLAAELNCVVLMVGMPDNDEEVCNARFGLHKKHAIVGQNSWPGVCYSETLNAAIDHLIKVAPTHFGGLQIDPSNIALVGHSMGGGGVLYAASHHCRDRIKALVALNPCNMSPNKPCENLDQCKKYATGEDMSGEFGEGTLPFLADIKVPTLIYGSVAEYNRPLQDKPGAAAPMWPEYACVFSQVGSTVKQLYVDNIRDQKCMDAHMWLTKGVTTHADGEPWEVISNFLQQYLCGSAVATLAPPSNLHKWEISTPQKCESLIEAEEDE